MDHTNMLMVDVSVLCLITNLQKLLAPGEKEIPLEGDIK